MRQRQGYCSSLNFQKKQKKNRKTTTLKFLYLGRYSKQKCKMYFSQFLKNNEVPTETNRFEHKILFIIKRYYLNTKSFQRNLANLYILFSEFSRYMLFRKRMKNSKIWLSTYSDSRSFFFLRVILAIFQKVILLFFLLMILYIIKFLVIWKHYFKIGIQKCIKA